MSATIHYRKLGTNPYLKRVASPAEFISVMTEAFGESPWQVGLQDVDVLRGMQAAYRGEIKDNPYAEIVELVRTHENIELWPQY